MSKKITRDTTEVVVKSTKNKQVKTAYKQIVDKDTGEIIHQEFEKHFVAQVKSDNFYMCFFENFAPFYGLKHLSDVKLLICLCELADMYTIILKLSTRVRIKISDNISIYITNHSRYINRLKKSRLKI